MDLSNNIKKEKKSYLRKKWENFFINIVKKIISDFENENDGVLIVKEKEELNAILEKGLNNQKFKTVVIAIPLNNFDNLVKFFNRIDVIFEDETNVVVNYYSILWQPFFFIMSRIGITHYFENQCYVSKNILNTFLQSTNYKISHYIDESPIPINIFFITKFLYLISNVFKFLKFLSVTKICYLKKRSIDKKFSSMKASIIIPCKNEEKNIEKIIIDMKKLAFRNELIFIDDKSSDKTLEVIKEQKDLNPTQEIKIINGLGKGKYSAVKLGVENATGYYSMIFDADITVEVSDLNLFYTAISEGRGDIINGSRLIYKPYAGAMRTLNYYGNIFFALIVSYITSEKITDTLCGTKCFKTSSFKIFNEFEKKNNITDLWGDFNILFASSFYGLKIIDLPIRYKKREEGVTKMNKRFFFFKNMLKTCTKAFIRFKCI
jgi:hypothetical protein